MKGKKLKLVGLGLGVVVVFGLVGYFWQKSGRLRLKKETVEEKKEKLLKERVYRGDLPIRKAVSEKGILYDIEGEFLEVEVGESGWVLQGPFQIKGGGNNQIIQVEVGTRAGNVYLGSYGGSFAGSSSWKMRPVEEVVEEVGPGREVLVRYNLPVEINKEQFLKKQEILDGMLEQHARGDFSEDLVPETGFRLVTHRMGVVVNE